MWICKVFCVSVDTIWVLRLPPTVHGHGFGGIGELVTFKLTTSVNGCFCMLALP